MQKKSIAMMLVAGCAVGMLTGCGIPEEEHNAIIAEMEAKFKAEEEKLNIKIAEQDSVITSEKAKVRTSRIELDDATERIKGLQQKSAETATELASEKTKVAQLESELKTSKSATAAAQDQAMEAENKFNTLDVEYQELKRRFEMFQKNMSALNQASKPAAPKAATQDDLGMLGEPAPAPKTDAQKASSLLDQMGNL
jgi:chromosome segregation ATPase